MNVEASKATIIASVEVVVATLTGILLLSEKIGFVGFFGIAIMLISIVLMNLELPIKAEKIAEIKGIDIDLINDKYNNLIIKDRSDIAITPYEICEVLNEEPGSILKIIINDLETNILTKKLANEKNIIVKYLEETYL